MNQTGPVFDLCKINFQLQFCEAHICNFGHLKVFKGNRGTGKTKLTLI